MFFIAIPFYLFIQNDLFVFDSATISAPLAAFIREIQDERREGRKKERPTENMG